MESTPNIEEPIILKNQLTVVWPAPDRLDMYLLSQAFECFRHRSAFVMTALEHMAFKNECSLNHKDAAYGAGYFIYDLMDELQLIQKMVDKDLKTGD